MARPKNHTPSYLLHKSSGKARVTWTDSLGQRQEKLLPGEHGSMESKSAFARLLLELATTSRPVQAKQAESLNEALLAYLEHATGYYSKSNELYSIKYALRPIRELYGDERPEDFGPKKLAAVRESMVREGLTRQGINKRVRLIVRCFKWLVAEELVPSSVHESLKALSGLKAGKSIAKESEERGPVEESIVMATLDQMSGHPRAIVELLWLTGARPGELCKMTLAQLDTSGSVWLYRVAHHKSSHRGKVRTVALGPRAIAVLKAHLEQRGPIGPDDPVFSPLANREARFQTMRAERKTKVQPSQVNRKKKKPRRLPADCYSPNAISQAVEKAAKLAKVEHWFPYQLRHAFATRIRKQFGLEEAQVLLGHAAADVTQVYAQRDEAKAVEVAKNVG
jgi:integrase